MSFEDIIREAVEGVDGGIGGIIMGKDCIPVEQYIKGEYDLQSIWVEYAALLDDIKKISNSLSIGNTEELLFSTEKFVILMKIINDEYFISLILLPNGNIGKGRFKLSRAVYKVKEEL
jgi:predicted regulator of Ras-like GTPase activity (Roadblock/LC7/MglB family)